MNVCAVTSQRRQTFIPFHYANERKGSLLEFSHPTDLVSFLYMVLIWSQCRTDFTQRDCGLVIEHSLNVLL